MLFFFCYFLKVKVKFKKQQREYGYLRINLMVTLVEHFLATVKHFIGEPTKPQEFYTNKELCNKTTLVKIKL